MSCWDFAFHERVIIKRTFVLDTLCGEFDDYNINMYVELRQYIYNMCLPPIPVT